MIVTDKITDWVINKIKKEYRDDIALLIGVQGHNIDRDNHGECFDYFIPATERGYQLSQTFIIDKIGFDLYPRSWERTEKTAKMIEGPLLCIAKAQILYSRSKEDTDRFLSLQRLFHDNLNNPTFTYGKALENMDQAMDIYRTLLFETTYYKASMAGCYICKYLSNAVALMNNTYTDSAIFTMQQANNPDGNSRIYHCPNLKKLPDHYYQYSTRLLGSKNIDEIKDTAYHLIESCRTFLLHNKPTLHEESNTRHIEYKGLADWYQELSLWFRRIHYFCDNKMAEEAFIDASSMQQELIVVAEEFQFEEMDILSYYDSSNLQKLNERANQIENRIRDIITSHGATINEYQTVEEFLEKN